MKKNNLQNLSDVIKNVFADLGIEENIMATQASQAFEAMMGKYIMGYVESFEIKDRILNIRIKSPELKKELSMGKTKIKDHINQEMKQDYLKDVKFL